MQTGAASRVLTEGRRNEWNLVLVVQGANVEVAEPGVFEDLLPAPAPEALLSRLDLRSRRERLGLARFVDAETRRGGI